MPGHANIIVTVYCRDGTTRILYLHTSQLGYYFNTMVHDLEGKNFLKSRIRRI